MWENIAKSKIFFYGCLIFIVSIAFSSYLPAAIIRPQIIWFALAVACLALAIIFYREQANGGKKFYRFKLVFLCLFFFFFGFWRYSLALPLFGPSDISYYNGQEVKFSGIVNDEPKIKSSQQKLTISADSLAVAGQTRRMAVNGKVLATVGLFPSYSYGDRMTVECKLIAPEPINDFAYDRYLARYGVFSVCYRPAIKLISQGNGNFVYAKLFFLKKAIKELVRNNMPPPESGLVAGIVLGDTSDMDEETGNSFSRSGLSHIVAVSGLNITVLAAVVAGIFLFFGLGRRLTFYLSTIILIGYVIIVGLPASAMRAGLMGFLVLLALKIGRLNRLDRSTYMAAALMLLFEPRLLRDDIGFQLSFLAMLSIVYLYPIIKIILDRLGLEKISGIRDAMAITLASQFFTWPIIAGNFSYVSLVSLPANLLAAWPSSFLMVVSLASLGAGFIFRPVAFWLFLPSWLIAKYIIKVAELFAALPYSYVEIEVIWPGWIYIYYFILIIAIIKFHRGTRRRINFMI